MHPESTGDDPSRRESAVAAVYEGDPEFDYNYDHVSALPVVRTWRRSLPASRSLAGAESNGALPVVLKAQFRNQ